MGSVEVSGDRSMSSLAVPIALATLTAALHLATARDDYGLFRDELYYLACAEHLDFGYVDHPPLIAWIAWLGRNLLGESMLALRALPAAAAAATVVLCGVITRTLGGGRSAQSLACTATALSPGLVGNFGILTVNAFDVLLWTAAVSVLVRLLRADDPRGWIAFGAISGVALENKLSALLLGFGVAVGLLLARRWQLLRSRELWVGGAIALLLFLPHLVWQLLHDWPTLRFMANAMEFKNLPVAPIEFLGSQLLLMNPLAAPLALAGLCFYLLLAEGRPWRPLGWAFIVITSLLILTRSKTYYLLPSYTILFAPGGVAIARLASQRSWAWLPAVLLAGIAVTGLGFAPLAKPLLPVDSYVAYAERLGAAPSTTERRELGRLPQLFADRLGWPELVGAVAEVHRSLTPRERERACILGQNYGQAGAIDFYGEDLGLPRASSGHNSYHLWGFGECTREVWIMIGDDRERHLALFEDVELAATHTCGDCMPYENNKPIWIGRNLRLPVAAMWAQIVHYD